MQLRLVTWASLVQQHAEHSMWMLLMGGLQRAGAACAVGKCKISGSDQPPIRYDSLLVVTRSEQQQQQHQQFTPTQQIAHAIVNWSWHSAGLSTEATHFQIAKVSRWCEMRTTLCTFLRAYSG